MAIKAPRSSNYLGMHDTPVLGARTWLEPESLCYPSGGMRRRALALCVDDKARIIRCGIPDTFFTIPGFRIQGGKRQHGFLYWKDEDWHFKCPPGDDTSIPPRERG